MSKALTSVAELRERKTLTYREIERVYGLSYAEIKKLGAAGVHFTTYRVGTNNGRVLVDRASFEAYLDRNSVKVPA